MKREKVAVRVPGSTSNIGSGFDTLGLALKIHNTVRLQKIAGDGIAVVTSIQESNGAGVHSMVSHAADLFFRCARQRRIGFEARIDGEIPPGRGLGYSATVRVGILAGLNALTGACWTREQLLELAVILEGHPDNASPAVLGGFTVSGMVAERVRCLRFKVGSELKLVVLVPRFGIGTARSRALLPRSYSKPDTAHALNRAALITAALSSGNFTALRGILDDRVHQPYRRKLMPKLSRLIGAGERAGAIGGFLSGSGSSVICAAVRSGSRVAAAMRKEMPDAEVWVLPADNSGFRVSD
jgi:homoserine kinase